MTDPRPLRVLIVDDEPLGREGVALSCRGDPELEVVGQVGSGPEAVAAVAALAPDVVFLDIQMPGMTGFDVLAALPPPLPAIVFVTAYDDHAVRAFEVHAVDYVLKPVDEPRFALAVSRAKQAVRLAQVAELGERLLSAAAEARAAIQPGTAGTAIRRLAIRSAGRVILLDVADIDWVEAADYYVQIHVGGQSYLHRQSMTSLAAELDAGRFVRIHRGAIVNLDRVRELRRQGRRELVAVLQGGHELKVGRRHRSRLSRLVAELT